MKRYAVALVGDYNAAVPAHQAIPLALDMAARHHGVKIEPIWLGTARIRNAESDLESFSGAWCVPASPYENVDGALNAIRVARERQIPFLATCGGFQHALIEYARNVLGLAHADHAETNPDAAIPLITQLSCSLVEKEGELILREDSLLHKSYGALKTREGYRCSYGPNPDYETTLFANKFRVTARDSDGAVRGAELQGHPFFVGTLFQPERRALKGEMPPIIREFLAAMIKA
jgi:CTP synthase (UTP-ammonia lyase)